MSSGELRAPPNIREDDETARELLAWARASVPVRDRAVELARDHALRGP